MTELEALEQIGSRWQKGNMDRIYVNDLADWYGLRYSTYNTGNISSATLNGEKVSNSQARRIADDLNFIKLWYDVPTGQWMTKTLVTVNNVESYTRPIIAAIQARVAEEIANAAS